MPLLLICTPAPCDEDWILTIATRFLGADTVGPVAGLAWLRGGRVAARLLSQLGNSRGQALTATGSHSLPALQVPLRLNQKNTGTAFRRCLFELVLTTNSHGAGGGT